MKVHFKANKGYIYEANIPEFKDGKYLMEIAKQAKITETETLLGMGWLFKEGKIKDENGLIALA